FMATSTDCVIEHCIARGNAGAGFYVGATAAADRSCVRGCEAQDNAFDGICIEGSFVTVADCRATHNATNGIHVLSGTSCVIERTHVLGNIGKGVQIDPSVHFVQSTVARSNAVNSLIAAGNHVGEILFPPTNAAQITGNTGGAVITSDPYSNIAF